MQVGDKVEFSAKGKKSWYYQYVTQVRQCNHYGEVTGWDQFLNQPKVIFHPKEGSSKYVTSFTNTLPRSYLKYDKNIRSLKLEDFI